MYVQKRPGVDDFLRQMGEMYEVVVYTASLSAVRLLLRTEGGIRLMSISFFLPSSGAF